MKTLRIVTIVGIALALAGQAIAADTRSQKPASTQEATTTTTQASKAKGHEGDKGWVDVGSVQ